MINEDQGSPPLSETPASPLLAATQQEEREKMLADELRNIVNADLAGMRKDFGADADRQFREWAQNRARDTLARLATLSEPKPEETEQTLGNEAPVAHKAATPTPQTTSDLNSLRVKVATICFDAFLVANNFAAIQREDDEQLAFRGGSSKGLWIYATPDRHRYWGYNYATREGLREGEVNSWAVRHDYSSDLNACAEFEKMLNVNQWSAYADALDAICVRTHICPLTHWQAVVCATAEQRCRAFVATMEGKSNQ